MELENQLYLMQYLEFFPLDSGTIAIDEKDISSTKEFERAKYISRVFSKSFR